MSRRDQGAPAPGRRVSELCGDALTRQGARKHLADCAPAHDVTTGGGQRLVHIRATAPGRPAYWLDLEVRADAKLDALDSFVRRIWLECCGHSSAFTIGAVKYFSGGYEFGLTRGFGSLGQRRILERSMSAQAGNQNCDHHKDKMAVHLFGRLAGQRSNVKGQMSGQRWKRKGKVKGPRTRTSWERDVQGRVTREVRVDDGMQIGARRCTLHVASRLSQRAIEQIDYIEHGRIRPQVVAVRPFVAPRRPRRIPSRARRQVELRETREERPRRLCRAWIEARQQSNSRSTPPIVWMIPSASNARATVSAIAIGSTGSVTRYSLQRFPGTLGRPDLSQE
jgi:hypothetical protein